MLALVAQRLGNLRERVVFLGGSVIPLLITDPAAPPPRTTADVDLIIEAGTRRDYHLISARLRELGFREDMSEGAPICRWIIDEVQVDVMPTAAAVLGFTNRWYAVALRTAERRTIGGMDTWLVSAPCFLATKLEAFDGRGSGDFRASRDLEDAIALVDGRPELVEEVLLCPDDLRDYLAERVDRLVGQPRFIEALPGHLPGDEISQARVPIVMARLRGIAGAPGPDPAARGG
jgi:hypothetical protein